MYSREIKATRTYTGMHLSTVKVLPSGRSCGIVAPAYRQNRPLPRQQPVLAIPYHAPPVVVAPSTEHVWLHQHAEERQAGSLGVAIGRLPAPQLKCQEELAVGSVCSPLVGAAQAARDTARGSWREVEYEPWHVVDFALLFMMTSVSLVLLLLGALKAVLEGVRQALVDQPLLQLQLFAEQCLRSSSSDFSRGIPDAAAHQQEVTLVVEVAAGELLRPLARAARVLRLQLLRLQWRARRMVRAAAAL